MARDKSQLQNIDLSNPDYISGRIKDNTGGNNGTPVNERVYGDMHQTFAKLIQLAGITYNNLPDNETNGYQLIDAIAHLAGKNDKALELGKSGGNLTLPIKVSKLVDKEVITAKATIQKGSETSLKGTLDNVNKTVTYLGDFIPGEYLRLINLSSEIVVITQVDAFNLQRLCEDIGFMIAATNAQAKAGSINDKAITPLSLITAFSFWVNGADSDNYLADASQNGLLSKEQWQVIDDIGAPALRNRGSYIHGQIKAASIGTNYSSSGDISAKKTDQSSDGDYVEITFANAMDDTNYRLEVFTEALGNINFANDVDVIPFKKISTTKAEIFVERFTAQNHNLKIHIDVIQL